MVASWHVKIIATKKEGLWSAIGDSQRGWHRNTGSLVFVKDSRPKEGFVMLYFGSFIIFSCITVEQQQLTGK